MSTQKFKRQLLATGEIDNNLHYGPFAIHWWYFFKSNNNQETTFPIRLHMRIKYKIDQQEFIVRIVKGTSDDEWVPGYICESDTEGRIYSTPSAVVNESFKKYFDTKTRFSGPDVLGFGDEVMTKQLQVGVSFFPFKIVTNDIQVFVASIGSSYQEELNFAGSGYLSTFFHKYSGKRSLICQSIIDTQCQIDIYFQGELTCTYTGSTPTDVWNKLKILTKYDGKELFGLSDPFTIQKIKNYIDAPCCTFSEWDYIDNMIPAFEKHLKRKISVSDLNWHQFFMGWKEQLTTVIELNSHLASIYSPHFEITDTILGAWRRMLKSVGCTNITPYKKNISNVRILIC